MKKLWAITVLGLLYGLLNVPGSAGNELSGYASAEGRFFFSEPLFPGQDRHNASIAAEPEFYHEWNNGSSLTALLFGRLDKADSRRSHWDIRELNYLWLADRWELRIGIGKVFWGVTEFVHLVDVINQTDFVENIDNEDKLGQPMIYLSIPNGWGIVDMFVLPFFRERTFPGLDGRLRFALDVDIDNPEYESSRQEWHTDFAFRYSHSIENLDFGIYHFRGTGREPTLIPKKNNNGAPLLIPFYELIDQTGLDVQMAAGPWLWKLEALYRSGQGEDFFATVGGFEYTFVGIAETNMDLSGFAEWAFDDRGRRATTPFQNDVMLGLRLSLNDAAGTQVLAGISQDLDSSARTVKIEADRRIGASLRASLEGWGFFDIPRHDPFYSSQNDDFLRFELVYYY
jgi:hypothetical protein